MKKLGFGLMRLPLVNAEDQKSIDMDMLREMVDLFLSEGFTYFDTAYMYHEYRSEIAVREALVSRHKRESFTLASKLPIVYLKEEADNEKYFNEQMEKCGVDFFDYYMLHDINRLSYEKAERFNSFSFIQQMKKEGKIRRAGISYHDDAELLYQILTAHPELDFVQLQVNYLDWNHPAIQSRKCCETAAAHGKPIIVMEPVKGGTLADLPEEAEALLRSYAPDASAASWAIRFAASQKNVEMVLSGMSCTEQLRDNLQYMREFQPMEEEEYALLEKVVEMINESVSIPSTGCRYCVEGCPVSIPIPEYFALYNAEQQALNKGFSTQRTYYDNLIHTYSRASECIGCGSCEAACPQHLKVAQYMKSVAEAFERD